MCNNNFQLTSYISKFSAWESGKYEGSKLLQAALINSSLKTIIGSVMAQRFSTLVILSPVHGPDGGMSKDESQ